MVVLRQCQEPLDSRCSSICSLALYSQVFDYFFFLCEINNNSVSIYGSFFDDVPGKNSGNRSKGIKMMFSLLFAPLLATIEEFKHCKSNFKNSKTILKIKILVEKSIVKLTL